MSGLYRIVYVRPDGSTETAAAGLRSIDIARRTALTLMPPAGYPRPARVEIRAGSAVTANGQRTWRDNGGTVDDGAVAESGRRVIWRAAESRRGDQTVVEAEAAPEPVPDAPDEPLALTLFDAEPRLTRLTPSADLEISPTTNESELQSS